MVKNYFFTFIFLLRGLFSGLLAQEEPHIFKVGDFDLVGKVKSCLVFTNYGKEAYEFDSQGVLTKSITQFNDSDYDITHYKYEGEELLEKRTENYRGGKFDQTTSFASFFTTEQIETRKVTEKIFSYDESFLDAYQYLYGQGGNLIKIIRSGPESDDETIVVYEEDKLNSITTFKTNEVVQKTINLSNNNTLGQRTIITTQYIEGKPSSAIEEVFSEALKVVSKKSFELDIESERLIVVEHKKYEYDAQLMLKKLTTKAGGHRVVQEYIYQYDSGDKGNWVKQIITPDNTYTTRHIKYYPKEKKSDEK